VLTRIGETFAGRVAASLLSAVRLPELIVASAEEYEQLAIELAMSPRRLIELKRKLADNVATSPLFDVARYARNLESAYALIYERYHAGLPTEHTLVAPPV
jgi:predicted O-linked N-acetylglucosamine transferase (SPINDLY family)